jgi:hypothetical protein
MKHNLTAYDLVQLKGAEAGTDRDQVTLEDGTRVKVKEVTLQDLEKSQVCPQCEFELLKNEDKPCRVNCLRDGSYGVRFVRVGGGTMKTIHETSDEIGHRLRRAVPIKHSGFEDANACAVIRAFNVEVHNAFTSTAYPIEGDDLRFLLDAVALNMGSDDHYTKTRLDRIAARYTSEVDNHG